MVLKYAHRLKPIATGNPAHILANLSPLRGCRPFGTRAYTEQLYFSGEIYMSFILFLLLPFLVANLVDAVLTRLTESDSADKPKSEKYAKRHNADDIVDAMPSKKYKRQENSAPDADSLAPLSQRVAASEIPVFEEPNFDIAEFSDRNEELSTTA